MIKLVRESLIEGYGAGYSFTGSGGGFRGGLGGTTRGGFGGAFNYGGQNMMYTYEIKPLNHSLEQPHTEKLDYIDEIKVGSKISGYPVRSNAIPDDKKKITGIVHNIVTTDDGAVKYYLIQDETTQTHVKIDPLTANLIIYEPVRYYYDATDSLTSRRKQKIKAHLKEHKLVRESIF